MGEVRAVAVIGAGIVGRGMAQLAARGGYRTILEDILPAALRRAESEIRFNLDKAVEGGEVSGEAARAVLGRLEFARSVEEAARQADLVIEAVPDELESKLEIFTLLDKLCRPATILATTTCALTVSEVAAVTYRAPKCVGMRFAARKIQGKLLEVVCGLQTDAQTLQSAAEVARRMGQQAVLVREKEPAGSKS